MDNDGNAVGPPEGDWGEVTKILRSAFPTLQAVELSLPYLILRITHLPVSLWPFITRGLPFQVTTTNHSGHFNLGMLRRGRTELQTIDLRRGNKLSEPLFKQVLAFIQTHPVKVNEIFCFDNCWSMVILDDVDLNDVPKVLAS